MKYFQINSSSSTSDRPKMVLCLGSDEWKQMQELSKEGVRIQEENEKMSAEFLKKSQQSRSLTKNWPNTLLSKQKRRQQQREESMRRKEQEKIEQFNAIIERQKSERDEIIRKAKELVYSRHESSRQLASAVHTSAILDEREKQIKLKREFQIREMQMKNDEGTANRKEAEAYEKDIIDSKILQVQAKNAYKAMLDEQMQCITKDRQQTMEEKLREKLDWDDFKKEIEESKIKEKLKLEKEKAQLRQRQEEWRIVEEEVRRDERYRDEEENKRIKTYLTEKEETDKMRKQVEDRLKAEIFKRQAKVPHDMKPGQVSFTQEDEIREKAIEEENMRYEQKLREQREKKLKLRIELTKFQEEATVKAMEELQHKKEQRRWEMLQRLALQEADNAWRLSKQQKTRQRRLQLREILLAQWTEKDEKERKEKWDDVTGIVQEQREQRNKLLQHCQDIKEQMMESTKHIHPVLTAITKVKKLAGIEEDNKLVPFLQSNVPIKSVALYQSSDPPSLTN